MTDWSAKARETIGKVHAALPADATYAERKNALFDAYPFGPRAMWPYKTWCSSQSRYLARYRPQPKLTQLSPLERLMQQSKAA